MSFPFYFFVLLLLSLTFCEFVSEVSSCLLCRVTGNRTVNLCLSSVFSHRDVGWGRGAPVIGISPPLHRWSAQCTSFPNSFFFSSNKGCNVDAQVGSGIFMRRGKKKKKEPCFHVRRHHTSPAVWTCLYPALCLAALFISALPGDVVKRAVPASRTVERVFQTEKCHALINLVGRS